MILSNIRKLCEERGTNLFRLEKECGLSNGTISKWADVAPKVTNLKLVADYFGVTIDSLLEEGDHAETDQ